MPIITSEAPPALKPMTKADARLMLDGKISCDILMHKGRVEIMKKPPIIKKAIDIKPCVLKVK
ncbi:MAG: hypothetical protein IMZ63_00555 [Actinobacteria bacterium]|nr:hypothetical protein [Actinomycetota bacterium]